MLLKAMAEAIDVGKTALESDLFDAAGRVSQQKLGLFDAKILQKGIGTFSVD